MSIKWEKIYEHNSRDNNQSGKKFEELAIKFLSDTFSDFTWIQTKASWDNNRDMLFAAKNGEDIWGEAKYKKNSGNVGKKDLDPTILSGLVDGKVKMVIYISNGTIANHNFERISYAANLRDIKVTYIGRYQLECWLKQNPEIYEVYFGEQLSADKTQNTSLVKIENVNFYNTTSIDFRPFENKTELLVGEDYLLCFSIYSNQASTLYLQDTNLPFIIVDHPSFYKSREIKLSVGLNSIFFFVNVQEENTKPLVFEFETAEKESIIYCRDITCIDSKKPRITHTSQNDILISIDKLLTSSLNINAPHIITVHSDSGLGKTYLMEHLLKNYNGKFDMSLIKFNDNDSSNVNYMLFCKIIIFLSFGNIFWNDDNFDSSDEDYKAYCNNRKTTILNMYETTHFSTELLGKIYDGCFDFSTAKTAIELLTKEISNANSILINPLFCSHNRILLLDDVHKLKGFQSKFFLTLLRHLKNINNTLTVLISYTHNKFTNKSLENTVTSLTSNDFTMDRLSDDDILNTVNRNIHIEHNHLRRTQLNHFPKITLMVEEAMYLLRNENTKYNNDIEFLAQYNRMVRAKNILTDKFVNVERYFFLIDIIYIYKKGILCTWITEYWGEQNHAIQVLKSMNIIKETYGSLYPYHDILTESYYSLRKDKIYNDNVGLFFEYILKQNISGSDIVDYNLLLSVLLLCGEGFYKTYIEQAIQKRDYYFNLTRFSEALSYAQAICDTITPKKEDKTNYSDDELYSFFVYADCLKHCGDIELSNNEFISLYENANRTSSIRYEAGAEVLNVAYRAWDVQLIDQIKVELKVELSKLIKDKKYTYKNDIDNRIIRAYYTCTNRLMLIAALQDNYEEAQKIYREAVKSFIKTQPSNDKKRIKAEIATYIMDYARCLYYTNPHQAYTLMKKALGHYREHQDNHFRRILICEVDCLFLGGIQEGNTWNTNRFYELETKLKDYGFKREYTKTVLKRCSGQLVEYFNELKISDRTDNKSLSLILEDVETAVSCVNIEYAKKTVYLANNIIALIEAVTGHVESAKNILSENKKMIKGLGNSYKFIAEHNYGCIEFVTQIKWAFKGCEYDKYTYLLDPRVW